MDKYNTLLLEQVFQFWCILYDLWHCDRYKSRKAVWVDDAIVWSADSILHS